MPRNTQKLTQLLEIINRQKLELERYKQLVANIKGLIQINGQPSEAEILAGVGPEQIKEAINRKVYETFKPKPKEETEEPTPTKQASSSRNLEGFKKTHVDELKEELSEQAGEGEEYPKPSKIKQKRKIPTDLKEAEEQERQRQAEEANKPKINISELPPEARAIIESNKARARAAEREKHHGKEGDEQYNRLLKKEAIEKGEAPAGGDCPHCGEALEAPIIRGYHDIC